MYRNEISVRFNDCDALGHVNNATYYTYFEEARTELFRVFNPSLDIHAWNLIVASTRCDFLQETTYAEKLTVYTWISRLGSSSFDVEQAIANEQGEWVARGKAALLGYDFTTKKAVKMSDDIRQKLLEHQDAPANVPALRE
ncbi:acyl-CoA thioesterase [Tumebacillus sp. ITR2]|uniref:Acyl-CoA thioesterase n=1 Tax=Tumebacillus amylolyticus TaxID=2801339 RepID=A0ABS1JGB0_9BACL|nr:thioesterase family protein [Tumebacillus amylolyticus]MBL0389319.1 acyl-CoA thioesterase [Tumebacillus amylolyticus]